MTEFTIAELEAAQKAMVSQIHKNERAKETLSQKQTPRTSQVAMISRNLKVLYISASLIEKALGKDFSNSYSNADLKEAVQIIHGLIQKIEKVMPKFREGTPQHTLAVRRVEAFHIVLSLIEREL